MTQSEALPSLRILLVEDDSEVRAVLSDLLSLEGVDVVDAADGEAAWNLLTGSGSRKIDAVISDISMPKLNGFQLLEKLRADTNFAKIPFILISGNPDRERAQSRDESGALIHAVEPDDFFPKPFDVFALIKRIQTLIQA